MGALGCSDGPVPSSVVCACKPTENIPASANAKTAARLINPLLLNQLLRDQIFMTTPREFISHFA
jgi:hypothetical protein